MQDERRRAAIERWSPSVLYIGSCRFAKLASGSRLIIDEALDLIVNYDVRYRMGVGTFEEENFEEAAA